MRLAVLGCGSMATAILRGLLNRTSKDAVAKQPISHITACVRSKTSAERLGKVFQSYNDRVKVVSNSNVDAATSADVVMLAHKPYQVQQVLGETGLAQALRGKKIISILAGVSTGQIRGALTATEGDGAQFDIIRAIPNMGAGINESMTLISDPHDASAELIEFTTWLFEQIGRVAEVSEAAYDVATVMTGACYALTTVAIEGIIDGALQQGLPREKAVEIAAQCLKGLATMLQEGEHPALLRESISSPAGATITGLVELERHAVRSAFAEAIIKATEHTKSMGNRQD